MMCRAGVGQGGGGTGKGYPPSPDRSKMEIRKCLDDILSTLKYVFCKAILYINIDNTHFELQNCKKIGTHCSRHEVQSGGGGGNFFAKPLFEARSAERGWDREGVFCRAILYINIDKHICYYTIVNTLVLISCIIIFWKGAGGGGGGVWKENGGKKIEIRK